MKKYTPYIVIVILCIICFNLYRQKKSVHNRLTENELAHSSSIEHFENKYKQVVASKLAIQLTNQDLINKSKGSSEDNKRLREAIKDYKKVIASIQTTQTVRIDTIRAVFKDTIPCRFAKNIEVQDKWYQFNQQINNKGFLITDFSLTKNKQDFVVGWKKQGWFKNPAATVEITNSNPKFNQSRITPIIVVYKKKWHEKWYITLPSAFTLGYLMSK